MVAGFRVGQHCLGLFVVVWLLLVFVQRGLRMQLRPVRMRMRVICLLSVASLFLVRRFERLVRVFRTLAYPGSASPSGM